MDADVVVAGAGPTGLLLAGDLAARGVSVSLLERRGSPSEIARAFVVHARSLEVLDARGLADALVESGMRLSELWLPGGMRVRLDGLACRFPFMLAVPQPSLEALLTDRARRCGVDIRYGATVEGIRSRGGVADGADTSVRMSDGQSQVLRSRCVVGADGVASTVRRAIGLSFPGRSVVQSVMLADVRLASPPSEVLMVNAVAAGFAFLGPLTGGWYRVVAWNRDHQRPDDAPVEFDEIRQVASGRRSVMTSACTVHGGCRGSTATSGRSPGYRGGPVFLAGDAAHVHSPVLGQGLNTGVQDASNLGWKLVDVVQGRAAEGLLDSYHDERHAVGRQVLRSSGAVLRMAMVRSGVLRRVRNAASTATRLPAVRRRTNESISGIGIRYRRPPGAHWLVGARAPGMLPCVARRDGSTRRCGPAGSCS